MTPSLVGDPHLLVDGQGGTTYHDIYTARGDLAFSPWSDPNHFKTVGQINLSYVSLVKADTLYLGSIVNTSRAQFQYYNPWFSGSTLYLVNQFHLTANQPSAVTSVAIEAFRFIGDQASMSSISNLNSSLKTTQISSKTPTLLSAISTTYDYVKRE